MMRAGSMGRRVSMRRGGQAALLAMAAVLSGCGPNGARSASNTPEELGQTLPTAPAETASPWSPDGVVFPSCTRQSQCSLMDASGNRLPDFEANTLGPVGTTGWATFEDETGSGLVSISGEIRRLPERATIHAIQGERLVVEMDERFGLMSVDLEWILPAEAIAIRALEPDMFEVETLNGRQVVDAMGVVVLTLEAGRVEVVFGDHIVVSRGRRKAESSALHDRTGRLRIAMRAGRIFVLGADRVALPVEGQSYLLADADGTPLSDRHYKQIMAFRAGLAAAQTEQGWGYLDRDGNIAIAPQYRVVGHFNGDSAPVKRGDSVDLIDRSGRMIAENIAAELYTSRVFRSDPPLETGDGLRILRPYWKDGVQLHDSRGAEIGPVQDHITRLGEAGYFQFETDNGKGLMFGGRVITPADYDAIRPRDGYFEAEVAGAVWALSMDGRRLGHSADDVKAVRAARRRDNGGMIALVCEGSTTPYRSPVGAITGQSQSRAPIHRDRFDVLIAPDWSLAAIQSARSQTRDAEGKAHGTRSFVSRSSYTLYPRLEVRPDRLIIETGGQSLSINRQTSEYSWGSMMSDISAGRCRPTQWSGWFPKRELQESTP